MPCVGREFLPHTDVLPVRSGPYPPEGRSSLLNRPITNVLLLKCPLPTLILYPTTYAELLSLHGRKRRERER